MRQEETFNSVRETDICAMFKVAISLRKPEVLHGEGAWLRPWRRAACVNEAPTMAGTCEVCMGWPNRRGQLFDQASVLSKVEQCTRVRDALRLGEKLGVGSQHCGVAAVLPMNGPFKVRQESGRSSSSAESNGRVGSPVRLEFPRT